MMGKKGFWFGIVIVTFIGGGLYFIAGRQDQPVSKIPIQNSSPITLAGEMTCLPKIGQGPQTMECAIGLKSDNGQYYGLKNLYEFDPEYKLAAGGARVEVVGVMNPEKMTGPDGNSYDVAGTIEITSIKEVGKGGALPD